MKLLLLILMAAATSSQERLIITAHDSVLFGAGQTSLVTKSASGVITVRKGATADEVAKAMWDAYDASQRSHAAETKELRRIIEIQHQWAEDARSALTDCREIIDLLRPRQIAGMRQAEGR